MNRMLQRRDLRIPALLLVVLSILLSGTLFSFLPKRGVQAEPPVARNSEKPGFEAFSLLQSTAPSLSAESASVQQTPTLSRQTPVAPAEQALKAAREALRNRQYNRAISLLTDARDSLTNHAESYLIIGQALEGKKDPATARDFYRAAIDRNPYLSEAYWGYATTSESLGDLESALGAMRSYLHTDPDPNPQRLKINQARSAIWEWESQLGRGAWGPTKGIPPGFTAAELKRDGRGVGLKMPLWETAQADGQMKYEIKHADKIKIYPRP